MERSNSGITSKAEIIIKPVFLKAGIPLALSIAAFVCARIIARKTTPKSYLSEANSSFRADESFHSFNSAGIHHMEDGEPIGTDSISMDSVESSQTEEKLKFEDGILALESRFEDLQRRGAELEMKFIFYQDFKEQESVLVELKNLLMLETVRMKFLNREISSTEAEKKRLERFAMEYPKILEQLEYQRSENRLLETKVKQLSRKSKAKSQVIREKISEIEVREAEIMRNANEIEARSNEIKNLEDEVRELHMILELMQEEKSELSKKLELIENSAPSTSKCWQIEEQGITMEDYARLVNELERLQKDRAVEIKELINLRWSNACLRYEMLRNHHEQEEQNEKKNHLEIELEGNEEIGNYGLEQEIDNKALEQNQNFFDVSSSGDRRRSKRRRLIQKLRRWVEGTEKMKGKVEEKERNESKCFGRHSSSDGGVADEQLH